MQKATNTQWYLKANSETIAVVNPQRKIAHPTFYKYSQHIASCYVFLDVSENYIWTITLLFDLSMNESQDCAFKKYGYRRFYRRPKKLFWWIYTEFTTCFVLNDIGKSRALRFFGENNFLFMTSLVIISSEWLQQLVSKITRVIRVCWNQQNRLHINL